MIIVARNRKNLARRFWANVGDYFIFFLLMLGYGYVFDKEVEPGHFHVEGIATLGILVIWFVYFPFCEGLTGQTLAKKALGLHVVDLKGDKPGLWRATLRRLFDFLDLFMMFGLYAVMMIKKSPKNQRLGDMVAGTTVVNLEATCRYCGSYMELTPQEVMSDNFQCPSCMQVNKPAMEIA